MPEPIYKLIASDLDSTLITESLTLPEINAAAVARARQAGCHFVVCSGRATRSIEKYEEQLGLMAEDCYGISFNGSVVYNTITRKAIRDVRLGNALAMEIVDELMSQGVIPWVHVGDDLFIVEEDEWVREYARRVKVPYTKIGSFREISGEISKVQVAGYQHNLQKLDTHFNALADTRYNSFFTAEFLYEFTAKHATKGEALVFLADYLGIPISQTIAIGDNLNDVHMIQSAGLGIAVNNARAELKALAGYITQRNCEQGAVAEVIEKFVIQTGVSV
ncbi:MAG: Cof-type HAD-IIB family hydrolase [Defluviitaleaceae bacterium]|nr:Cof-type HAD-IIB family hydrolase [Defluviitaleaceae bacterium]